MEHETTIFKNNEPEENEHAKPDLEESLQTEPAEDYQEVKDSKTRRWVILKYPVQKVTSFL